MVWETAGYLAGMGIRKAAANAAEKARLRQAMDPAGAAIPRPLLDIERVITDGRFFRLGVPWGWYDLSTEELNDAKARSGLPVAAGFAAERTEGPFTAVLICPVDMQGEGIWSLTSQPEEFHRSRFSRVPAGHPLGSPRKILIDGELGLFFHYGYEEAGASTGQQSLPVVPMSMTECYFCRHGQGFKVEFATGSRYHERYLPCLWTMFGSWRWMR